MGRLGRLLRPSSVAVVGGRAWCAEVVRQNRLLGFAGRLDAVHPTAADIGGLEPVRSIEALPAPPDAVFLAVNRHDTIDAVRRLAAIGAGGVVCFASGFSEAEAELGDGRRLQDTLVAAAGDMPILGPNCYGFVNYLDGAALWPDQQGGERVGRGVAIVTQSSNIAINLTMQCRALPIAAIATAGNQAAVNQADLARALLEDPRVTALGLHVEGFRDIDRWEALARRAAELGKPLVAIKVGRSAEARAATISHTASLAGSDAGASALLGRLGIARVDTLPELLGALSILHVHGPLGSNAIATISCSGGEASLSGDLGAAAGLRFPRLDASQRKRLGDALGPRVALANPLDYHTYVWRDEAAMARAWTAIASPELAIVGIVLDYPRADRCDDADWDIATRACLSAAREAATPFACIATLPELMPEARARQLLDGGVVPLAGLRTAMAAIRAAGAVAAPWSAPVFDPGPPPPGPVRTLTEAEAKARLAAHGLAVPRNRRAPTPEAAARAAETLGFPVVLKGEGIAHKTEAGAVRLDLRTASAVQDAAAEMNAPSFLVEEMVSGATAELLVGITRDPAHGLVLSVGAGGTLAELLDDCASTLLPAPRAECLKLLQSLRLWPVLEGWRGAPRADADAILDAIEALSDYALANARRTLEVEVNPLVAGPDGAVAVDALIREVGE